MDAWLVLCRLLHYGSAILLFGTSLFQSVLAPPALAEALSGRLKGMVTSAVAVAGVTAIGWLILVSGEMGEGWSDAWSPRNCAAVLFDTAFGQVWQLHLLLGLSLVLLWLYGRLEEWPLTTVLSGLFLASLGFVGHAVMRSGGWGWTARASQALHLLAAGFWLGSLVPLLLCLQWLGHPALSRPASIALRRFSGLGHGAVALVLFTGAVNTGLMLGAWPADPASPYQVLLLAKIGIVAAMVAIAVINRYRFVPRLAQRPEALRSLRAATITEVILGLVALGLVALFGTLSPT